MNYSVDDMTAAERPRRRLLMSAVAVLLPVLGLVGAAAWFVRSYVLPPTIAIEPRAAVATPAVEPETTGAAPPAAASPWSEPTVRYSSNSAEVWASVPVPGPSRPVQRLAPEPAAAIGEAFPAAVPLPPRRPPLAAAEFDLPAVPLPRPRPSN